MIIVRSNVRIDAEVCDVHARLESTYADDAPYEHVAWCGVYVRPSGPVNGYWYFLQPRDARTLLVSLGALPIGAVN